MKVLFCGDPAAPPYQVLLTGPHLNLRLGGESREGVAFGGPQVYGDQRGDSEPGLPGNLYADQLAAGQRLFTSMTAAQRERASCPPRPSRRRSSCAGATRTSRGCPSQRWLRRAARSRGRSSTASSPLPGGSARARVRQRGPARGRAAERGRDPRREPGGPRGRAGQGAVRARDAGGDGRRPRLLRRGFRGGRAPAGPGAERRRLQPRELAERGGRRGGHGREVAGGARRGGAAGRRRIAIRAAPTAWPRRTGTSWARSRRGRPG